MPGPVEGEIYFSARAGRFYQAGRQGALSRDTGVRSLTWDEERAMFRDQRGNLIREQYIAPAGRSVNHILGMDSNGRPFVSTNQNLTTINEEAVASFRPATNQDVVARLVVHTPDGQAHVFTVSGGLGNRVDPAELAQKAVNVARGRLLDPKYTDGNPYEISTGQIKGATVDVTFQTRTTGIKPGR